MSNAGKYYEIGEIFKEGDVTLKVVRNLTSNCVGCYFEERPIGCLNAPECRKLQRKSKYSVRYEKQEE